MDAPLRLVVIVAYDGVQLLDVAGPADVFDGASRGLAGQDEPVLRGEFELPDRDEAPAAGYRLLFATPTGQGARGSNGARLEADAALDDIEPDTVDDLIVCGGPFVDDALSDPGLVEGIARLAAGARRACSVCSGAFLLAEAGALDGRRATSHWAACQELARRHPTIEVEADRIFVRDGSVATSAGVTAGIDLALALVEEDHGPDLAIKVARWLVVFLRRPGGQSQFSERLELPASIGPEIREIADAVSADPAGDHRVAALAARAAMSERHLARVFARETGTTPGRFVERVRVEAARAELERSGASIEMVARSVGFGSPETMRRAFGRLLGVSPNTYRGRFRHHPSTPDQSSNDLRCHRAVGRRLTQRSPPGR